ncbi:MAP7 domain-containing protein 2-like [Periplaneta americana]|uniref:MAP7 domain-containing protein 2-like n=1 Tax=Periplaneta americana TaxID=6978 RepID=UPI0037E80791
MMRKCEEEREFWDEQYKRFRIAQEKIRLSIEALSHRPKGGKGRKLKTKTLRRKKAEMEKAIKEVHEYTAILRAKIEEKGEKEKEEKKMEKKEVPAAEGCRPE